MALIALQFLQSSGWKDEREKVTVITEDSECLPSSVESCETHEARRSLLTYVGTEVRHTGI